MIGINVNRATKSNFTCTSTPFFFHTRTVGTDVYADATIILRGYGNEHADQKKCMK